MKTVTTNRLDAPIRRPEVARLAEQLKRQHPDWSEQECITQAKQTITSKPQKP